MSSSAVNQVRKLQPAHAGGHRELQRRQVQLWSTGCFDPAAFQPLEDHPRGKMNDPASRSPVDGDLRVGQPLSTEVHIDVSHAVAHVEESRAGVAQAVEQGEEAAGIYLQELKSILKTIRCLHSRNKKLEQEATKGVAELSKALKAAYGETLKVS